MFTEADLAALVPRKIFERGSAYYYEDNAVGHVRRTGNTFKAQVEGSETYRVELTVRPRKLLKIRCDCPYEHGDVCKHGIALGLAVLEWFGDGEPTKTSIPAPPTRQYRHAQLLAAAWARTSDRERLAFLQQLLSQKPKQLRRFLKTFEFDNQALLAAADAEQSKPRLLPARRPPSPRRPPTFLEQAHDLINKKKHSELLPLLLTVDWLRESQSFNAHEWPHLLAESARAQPEATFDAVMERFESYLAKPELRGWPLYNWAAACLQALAQAASLTKQVQLFASELLQHYYRLSALRQALATAGFLPIESEMATGLPPKRRGRQPKKPPP